MTRSIAGPEGSSKTVVSSFVENLALQLSDNENMATGESLGEKHCGSTGIVDDELVSQNGPDTTPQVMPKDSVWKAPWDAAPKGEESLLHNANANGSENLHGPHTSSAVASVSSPKDGIDLALSGPECGNSAGVSLLNQSHMPLISLNKELGDLPYRCRSFGQDPQNRSTADGPSNHPPSHIEGATSERGTRIMADSINLTTLEDVVPAKDEISSDSSCGLIYVNSVCR